MKNPPLPPRVSPAILALLLQSTGCVLISADDRWWEGGADGAGDSGEGGCQDEKAWYADGDGDGYGDTGEILHSCDQPAGYSAAGGDCDDSDGAAWPGAEELCDGLDNDCDADQDEGLAVQTYYLDRDGDGYGETDSPLSACALPAGHADASGDCEDTDAAVHPGAAETCGDALDNDCDGETDAPCFPAGWFYAADSDVIIEGSTDDLPIGMAVARGGDLDGDGRPDVAVGGPGWVGVARVDQAGAVKLDYEAATISGPAELRTGDMLVGGFDFDADGSSDLAVREDYAWLLFKGPLASPSASSSCDARFDADQRLDVAAAGDLVEGGGPELLLGSTESNGGEGAVFLVNSSFSESAGFEEGCAAAIWGDEAALQQNALGYAVSAGVDVDGDGFQDALVGVYGAAGGAVLVPGPLAGDRDAGSGNDLWFEPRYPHTGAGQRVALVPDYDGDGYGDLLIAAPYVPQKSFVSSGEVYVVSGRSLKGASALNLENADATIIGYDNNQSLGLSLDSADIDGDEHSDLLIGAYYGTYLIYFGPVSGTLTYEDADTIPTCPDAMCSFTGAPMLNAGDLFGTSQEAVVIGAPYMDRDKSGFNEGGALVIWGGFPE